MLICVLWGFVLFVLGVSLLVLNSVTFDGLIGYD
jgi:hypothetical protein